MNKPGFLKRLWEPAPRRLPGSTPNSRPSLWSCTLPTAFLSIIRPIASPLPNFPNAQPRTPARLCVNQRKKGGEGKGARGSHLVVPLKPFALHDNVLVPRLTLVNARRDARAGYAGAFGRLGTGGLGSSFLSLCERRRNREEEEQGEGQLGGSGERGGLPLFLRGNRHKTKSREAERDRAYFAAHLCSLCEKKRCRAGGGGGEGVKWAETDSSVGFEILPASTRVRSLQSKSQRSHFLQVLFGFSVSAQSTGAAERTTFIERMRGAGGEEELASCCGSCASRPSVNDPSKRMTQQPQRVLLGYLFEFPLLSSSFTLSTVEPRVALGLWRTTGTFRSKPLPSESARPRFLEGGTLGTAVHSRPGLRKVYQSGGRRMREDERVVLLPF